MSECILRAANERPGLGCDAEACLYWRAVEGIGLADPLEPEGCAVQKLRLLEGGAEVAEWLLSVKERVEANASARGPAESDTRG